jgi:hypothetical protein
MNTVDTPSTDALTVQRPQNRYRNFASCVIAMGRQPPNRISYINNELVVPLQHGE